MNTNRLVTLTQRPDKIQEMNKLYFNTRKTEKVGHRVYLQDT